MDVANLISILILFGSVLAAAFFQLSIMAWTALIGIPLFLFSVLGYLSLFTFIILWLLFLAAALFANLKKWREHHIIKPALANLRKQMPTISTTEREAIEAGDTWWEKELFCGRPKWEKLFTMPRPTLTAEEEAFLNNQVNQVCSMIDDWEIVNNEANLSPAVWEFLKKEKFFGMAIPKEYGGLQFSALAHSTVITKLASKSVSAAVTTMVPNSLGPAELLLRYGTQEQKDHYLPGLAQGTEIPCFALTAPDAGSDAGAIPDTGIVAKKMLNGKEVLGIRLTWDKRYITLAPLATVLGLAFHLYDPDYLLGDKEDIGITLCLIPTSHPGVQIGHRHYPMFLGFMNGPTRGKDVFIPLDWIIGGKEMAGQGWRMLMECLSIGRSISLPALATACGKLAYRMTGAYSRVRRQFNTPIAYFEGVEEALGYIGGYAYLLEATRIMTAGAIDQKINPAIVSAMAKCHMTEMSRRVVSHAMDIHAGHAIQAGPRNLIANIYLAVPTSITVEGANILTRNLIIFGQGAIRCHPYILKEIELLSQKDPDVQAVDNILLSHLGFFVSNFIRSFAYGLSGGRFIFTKLKNKKLKKYERQLTRMSAALALLADASMILLGGSLKRRERISARLGDIMSQLYLASAVLKYFHDQGEPETDVNYVAWAVQTCLYQIQTAIDDLLNNFPRWAAGKLIKFIIFPLGRAYSPASDKLHKSLLSSMLAPSDFRDRLTRYCYVGEEENNLLRRLDAAIQTVPAIEPLAKKLQQSNQIPHYFAMSEKIQFAKNKGILTPDEAEALQAYEALRTEIIKVNEFTFNLDKVIA